MWNKLPEKLSELKLPVNPSEESEKLGSFIFWKEIFLNSFNSNVEILYHQSAPRKEFGMAYILDFNIIPNSLNQETLNKITKSFDKGCSIENEVCGDEVSGGESWWGELNDIKIINYLNIHCQNFIEFEGVDAGVWRVLQENKEYTKKAFEKTLSEILLESNNVLAPLGGIEGPSRYTTLTISLVKGSTNFYINLKQESGHGYSYKILVLKTKKEFSKEFGSYYAKKQAIPVYRFHKED